MNPTPNPRAPSASRAAVALIAAVAAGTVLLTLPGSSPPADPGEIVDWWTAVGPTAASIGLVRLAGVALAFVAAAMATFTLLVATLRLGALTTLWLACTPRRLQRPFVAGGVPSPITSGRPSPSWALRIVQIVS